MPTVQEAVRPAAGAQPPPVHRAEPQAAQEEEGHAEEEVARGPLEAQN